MTPRETKLVTGFVGSILGIFVLIGLAGLILPRNTTLPAPPRAPQNDPIMPGDEGRIKQDALVAVDDSAWDAMTEALTANDKIGLAQLLVSGRVFSIDKGTKVLVLDIGLTSTKIRALTGTQAGKAGWIIREWVQR